MRYPKFQIRQDETTVLLIEIITNPASKHHGCRAPNDPLFFKEQNFERYLARTSSLLPCHLECTICVSSHGGNPPNPHFQTSKSYRNCILPSPESIFSGKSQPLLRKLGRSQSQLIPSSKTPSSIKTHQSQ